MSRCQTSSPSTVTDAKTADRTAPVLESEPESPMFAGQPSTRRQGEEYLREPGECAWWPRAPSGALLAARAEEIRKQLQLRLKGGNLRASLASQSCACLNRMSSGYRFASSPASLIRRSAAAGAADGKWCPRSECVNCANSTPGVSQSLRFERDLARVNPLLAAVTGYQRLGMAFAKADGSDEELARHRQSHTRCVQQVKQQAQVQRKSAAEL